MGQSGQTKVSIITVTFNSSDHITQCVESVNEQTYPNIEQIFIDGGSTDGTVDIIKSVSGRAKKIVSEPDRGIYDAMNKGIRLSSGDIIGILNSDDFFTYAEAVSDVVSHIQSKKADSCYADIEYVDAEDTSRVIRRWKSGQYKNGKFLYGWMPPHPTFFVNRSIYDEFGVFNQNLGTAADYELMFRFIHKHEISVSYLSKTLIKMRGGGASNKSILNRIQANLNDRRAWKINGFKPKFYTLFLKPLRKVNQFILNRV